jgi:hypothetical protein
MDTNGGKFFTGHIKDYARGKGWFFGHFMDEKLLQSDLVDVSWQHYFTSPKPFGEGGPAAHYHKGTVEINVVIAGGVTGKIEGKKFRVIKGQFYVLWPETTLSDFNTDPDTEVIVIRAPSIKDGGKVYSR